MNFPFTQSDYDYIDAKIKNREDFKVEKKRLKVPGKSHYIDFEFEGRKLDEEEWKRIGLWSEPYLLSEGHFSYGGSLLGPSGGNGPTDVQWVSSAKQWIEDYVKTFGFEPEEEQMRWF